MAEDAGDAAAGTAIVVEAAGEELITEQFPVEQVPVEPVTTEQVPAEQALQFADAASEDSPRSATEAADGFSEALHQELLCEHEHVQRRGTIRCGWRRGLLPQSALREHECRVRRHAVSLACWAIGRGARAGAAATCLGVSPRTLRHWRRRFSQNGLAAKPRGRHPRRSPREARVRVLQALRGPGRGAGLPTLRALVPDVPRAELTRTLKRFRRVRRLRYGWGGYRLTWRRPGAVWAMDFVLPASPVDDLYPCVLSICDQASRFQLLWQPMLAETAETVIQALGRLFICHGPPLVLKSDNGPPFVAAALARFLAQWRVTPLFSPPCRPWYNGICERANGLLSVSTTGAAEQEGHPEFWTSANLEQAREWHNAVRRPVVLKGRTSAEVWELRVPLSAAERDDFLHAVELGRRAERAVRGHTADEVLDHAALAAIDRVAVRDALCALGYLTIQAKNSGRVLAPAARPCLGVTPVACALAAPGRGSASVPSMRHEAPGTDGCLPGSASAVTLLPVVGASTACTASATCFPREPSPCAAMVFAFAQPPPPAGAACDTCPAGQEIAASGLAWPEASGKLSAEAHWPEGCSNASDPVQVGQGLFHQLRRLITPLIDRLKTAKIP